ncbi:MAG: SpoIIE family protein phosphatase, partial [Coriobacteriia bacterium]|nr:SpoIIE family protein phosphatase [Coriobacteriia bacterium]
ELMRRYRIKSVIAIPLRFREEQVGTLYLMYHRAKHVFSDIEREFARRLSAMLSMSVENTRLFQAEREIADTLQAALLATPETIDGLEVAHAYRSASGLARIGGDFFDVFEIRPGIAAVLIGDVSGKGLEAATFTAMARGSIRAFAYSYDSPGSVLTAANRAIVRQTGDVRFVTAVFMTIDVPRGVARVSCAGHPAPILCHPEGCERDSAVRNPPLGVLPELQFEEYEVLLRPGDRLVLFTDGLIDARHEGTMFGVEGVRDVLEGLADATPDEIVRVLLAEADSHARGSSADDVASLVLRYDGTPGE